MDLNIVWLVEILYLGSNLDKKFERMMQRDDSGPNSSLLYVITACITE